MLIFQGTRLLNRKNSSKKGFESILTDFNFQLNSHHTLENSILNFYNKVPISERLSEVMPAQPVVSDNLFTPLSPILKTNLSNSEGILDNSNVTAKELSLPAGGYLDVGYITKPSLAAYRQVLSKFEVDKTGEEQLAESVHIPLELILAFFSNALEGRIPDEARRQSLIEGIDGTPGLRQKLENYFHSLGDKQSASAQEIFDQEIIPFLLERGFSDSSGNQEDKITPIHDGFFNQPKNMEQIIISATSDRVATSSLSTDDQIREYDKQCFSDNVHLLDKIAGYVGGLFGADMLERLAPYLYYNLAQKDLSNPQAIEKVSSEIGSHLKFIDDIFISKTWLLTPNAHPEITNGDFRQYYEKVMASGAARGFSEEQTLESIRTRMSELESIRSRLNAENTVLGAWRDFSRFKAKYASARYFEYDADKRSDYEKGKFTPEEFAKNTLKSPDFLKSEDIASLIAVTSALNIIGRNLSIKPSLGKNLMSINFEVPEGTQSTVITQASSKNGKSLGVTVVSKAQWEVSIVKSTTIIVPDMEILLARATDYLRLANSQQIGNKVSGVKITSELSKDGSKIIFTLQDKKKYANLEDAKNHQTTFYVPSSLHEDAQDLAPIAIYVSKLDVETFTDRRVKQPDPVYFNAGVSFGAMDYENLHTKEKTVTSLYGQSNVAGESLRGDRPSAIAGLDYANWKFGLGVPTKEGVIAESWGESKVKGWSKWWWDQKIDGMDKSNLTLEDLKKFFWANASIAMNETIQQKEQASMEESKLLEQYRDKTTGELPQVYSSLENMQKYIGPIASHKYTSDMYLSFLKSAYERMPSSGEKDKLFEHIYQTYVDNLNFYPKEMLKDQQGLQFVLGRGMRLMEELTKRMIESGVAVHLESSRLAIPFTNIGVNTNGTFFADLAYVIPYGQYNDQWDRETSFGPAVSVPGLAGSSVSFQNMDGFAATLGWKGLLWTSKTEKSHLSGKFELGFFVAFPSKKQTEEIQALMDSADRIMGIWSKYDHKDENSIDKMALRTEINNLRLFFGSDGPKPDSKAIDLLGKMEYALNNQWDDPSRTNLEGLIHALAQSDLSDPGHIYTYYSGETLGASFMSYGTFMNELGAYQGVERFANSLGAGFAKIQLDFDSEISTNLPYNVRVEIHPVVPFLISKVATSAASERVFFEGEKEGQVLTSKKIMETMLEQGKDYLSPDLPTTIISSDFGYIYPFSSGIAAKIGLASSFNLFAFDMEKSDFYLDFRISDWASVRFKHGFEKVLKHTPYSPNMGASAQIFLGENLGKLAGFKMPVDLNFNMLWERDLPHYGFSDPHLETFGYNFTLSTSITKIFGQSEENKKALEQNSGIQTTGRSPAYGLQDRREPKETFLQWRLDQQETEQKDGALLRTLTPDERQELEGRKALMASDSRSYYHPQTRELLNLEDAVSEIHHRRWTDKLLGLLTNEERVQLESRRSSVYREPMFLDKLNNTYVPLEDAVFEMINSKAKSQDERDFVKWMSSG